jgi:hypothetical protein
LGRTRCVHRQLSKARSRRSLRCIIGWLGTIDPDQILTLKEVQNYWHHWYMALERGALLVCEERLAFTRYIWTIWNPNWTISDEEFARTAASFENPDWAETVIHSYRVRLGVGADRPDL